MKQADIVVIGGSAAGIAAAITARRHYPEKSIILIRKEAQVLIPCGIPYIFGTLGKPENNLIPDSVLQNNNIELIVNEAVELHAKELDPREKKVVLANGELVLYDKLILATGSSPTVLPIPGFDKKNVYTIKKDAKYLQNLLGTLDNVKDLVILGCGFIGVEFADECKKNRDINVTIVEMLDQCLQIVFGEGACKCCQEIEDYLSTKGITIVTGTSIDEILGDEKITAVRLSNGKEIKADALIVGVGVSSNVELAKKAGLATSKAGVFVDTTMRTSDPNIFACGDCATKFSFFTGQPSTLRLASIATTEARIAGANLYEISRKNLGALGVFATAVGDLTVAIAGVSEKGAKNCGFEVVTGEAEAPDRHPAGMPGTSKMWVKLIFNKVNGELIGGAVKGGPSAGELINAISACIQNRMRANDIAIFQIGTHPAVTASPIAYPLVTAAEIALKKMKT
ncbi:MAG: FAD-dependent oxidoreductase [Candidatus Bathyarchaeota archaeon]|nr:FAD-dependent oxidoreductase [Candidatus Bathyarchaeota archaeon]